MKISIEHKKPAVFDGSISAEEISHNVTIEHPSDDLVAVDVARLMFFAMVACSYHPNSVSRAFYEIAIENGFDSGDSE